MDVSKKMDFVSLFEVQDVWTGINGDRLYSPERELSGTIVVLS